MTLFRYFKFILLVTLLMGVFSGCGQDSNKNKIVVWHWMTDRDDAFIALANKYKDLYGVDIVFELYAPSEAYASKVKAAAQTKTLPDIFGILGEKRDFASFIRAGHVADLSFFMNANKGYWKNMLFPKALAVNQFSDGNNLKVKPGIYGVPIDVTNIQLLYNKAMFKKAGLDPEKSPETWAELLEVGRKLKAAGLQGISSGFGEVWLLNCFASNYAFNILGEEKVLATIKGDVKYTDPDWIKVLSLFEDLRDNGLLATGVVSMVNKTAEQMFANERAALAFNGSWCINVYNGMNLDIDYGVFLPPKYSDKYPMSIWGGAGASFMVNDKSSKKEEAIKFLKWITEKDQQVFLAETTKNLPVNKNSLEKVSSNLAEFANDMDKTIHPSLFSYVEFPSVTETFDKGIQSIIIGEKTPETVAKEVQKVKDKELSRV
ncbi:MAG: extracellular solute-binding protein [bacterium]|nr:extracellular solute-binding protein [bacterium]